MTAIDRLAAIVAFPARTGLICPRCNGRLVVWTQWHGQGKTAEGQRFSISGAKAYCCICQQHYVRGNHSEWELLGDLQGVPAQDYLEAKALQDEELAQARDALAARMAKAHVWVRELD